MMHSAVLLKAEVKALQVANEQKKRRERKRKRRIMQGGSLSILKSVRRWQVRLLSRWVLQADRSAVAHVVIWGIMPVRARGARNQL
jgi:hypothetical protein